MPEVHMPEFFTKIKSFLFEDWHQSELEAKRHDASRFQSASVCKSWLPSLHFHSFECNFEVVFSFCIDHSATCSSPWVSLFYHAMNSQLFLLMFWRCYLLCYVITAERVFWKALSLWYISKEAINFWCLSNVNYILLILFFTFVNWPN
jgi:hypothetical protein